MTYALFRPSIATAKQRVTINSSGDRSTKCYVKPSSIRGGMTHYDSVLAVNNF
jgi:hypothetical protein